MATLTELDRTTAAHASEVGLAASLSREETREIGARAEARKMGIVVGCAITSGSAIAGPFAFAKGTHHDP